MVTGEDALKCGSIPEPSWHHHPVLKQKINRHQWDTRELYRGKFCFWPENPKVPIKLCACLCGGALLWRKYLCSIYSFAQILLHGPQSLVRAEFIQEIFTEPLAMCRDEHMLPTGLLWKPELWRERLRCSVGRAIDLSGKHISNISGGFPFRSLTCLHQNANKHF